MSIGIKSSKTWKHSECFYDGYDFSVLGIQLFIF